MFDKFRDSMFNYFLIFIVYYIIGLATGGLKTCIISFTFMALSILIVLIRNKIIGKKAFSELKLNFNYVRDIPSILDVSDVLFLSGKNFLARKNINLMLMQLKLNGIIEIKQKDNKTIINKTDKMYMVSYAEKYICDYITSKDKSSFNYSDYNKMVKKDILNKKLAYDDNDLSFLKFYFFFSSITFLIFASIYVYKSLRFGFDLDPSIVYGFVLLTFPNVILYVMNKFTGILNLKLTKKGFAYKYIVNSYKRFLKDFSRIRELRNEDYVLWEKHLLYAQALDINLKYYDITYIDMNIF